MGGSLGNHAQQPSARILIRESSASTRSQVNGSGQECPLYTIASSLARLDSGGRCPHVI